jgi:signal transduction histidine kinase
LSNIASEFSSFAQMPKSILSKVDLLDMMQSETALHQDASVSIALHSKLERPCYVLADKEQLLRVFNNLIKNAMQAIPEGKVGSITLGLVSDGEQWVASVQDNGMGIPEELRERVFVPNFTTKSAGMGLGLAMVQRIVESANGRIWFETETAVGTTFFVTLPKLDGVK